ncbi:hypothetical protein GF327_04770 [Candidatus Woesearchaeota archaeon]|nr:hypothetical protein [Candidatus Woesearchaeota archaeon]
MDISEVLDKHRKDLEKIQGVVGVGIGKHDQEDVIIVMTLDKKVKNIPEKIENYNIKIKNVGEIKSQ